MHIVSVEALFGMNMGKVVVYLVASGVILEEM